MRIIKNNAPVWRTISVEQQYSEKLAGISEIANNIWFTWNCDAIELFKYIAKDESVSYCIDPIAVLKETSFERLSELENDSKFLKKYNKIYERFQKYLAEPKDSSIPSVAYFSMEYGMTDIVKIFSGGLGVLAGDYLKQASDSLYDMAAVGLFYRQGYFTQKITVSGEQDAEYEPQKFTDLPAELLKDENGEAITVQIFFPGRTVNVQAWKLNVGRVSLFLLDTDRDDNSDEDRLITHRLYGGDNEHRLKQEMVLGIAGVRLLTKLGIKKEVYHINEGHAAFIGLERVAEFMKDLNMTFQEASEAVKSGSLFTTHTPVPAGHDSFEEEILMYYMGHYPQKFGISWTDFYKIGKMDTEAEKQKFSMSVLAANLSQEINGVSWLHGEVTKEVIFKDMWKGYFPAESHIGYVTNGVHYGTWTAKPWKKMLADDNGDPDFSKIHKQSDKDIWEIRNNLRARLVDFIGQRMDTVRVRRNEDPKFILKVKKTVNKDVLTIGFARRFATYKRGNLLFKDLERLSKIVNSADMPVQFVFAGKAHPKDQGGQDIIKEIISISKRKEFTGKIIFLENYNMAVAKQLVQGVDIWLNTPTRPLEASGTSGMKAVMNGVMNFSVLDGWWVEGYKEGAGWALPQDKTYEHQGMQNDLDAEMIYQIIENQIAPLFYKRNKKGLPEDWINSIKKCIAEIAPEFTTKRMIDDYQERFYSKIGKRNKVVAADSYKIARDISMWKDLVARQWNSIEVQNIDITNTANEALALGRTYQGELVMKIGTMDAQDIGAELVLTENSPEGQITNIEKIQLPLTKFEKGEAHFAIELNPKRAGSFNYGFRVYPKNENIPYRQDFAFVKWV